MRVYRHGDVIIREISDREYEELMDDFKDDPVMRAHDQSEATLAEGEVTGHSHHLETIDGSKTIEVMDTGQSWSRWRKKSQLLKGQETDRWGRATLGPRQFKVVSVGRDAKLTHEEHAQIDLPKGKYFVYQQREFWGEERRVYD